MRLIRALLALTPGLLLALVIPVLAADPHDHEGEEHRDEPLHLGADDLVRHGITVATAGPGRLDAGLELLGEIHPNGDRLAHITPRFPGIAKEVRRNIGDRVRKGDVLAVIESSESLATYELTTQIDGTVIAKHITRGEAVGHDDAFVVADLATVWADLRVYQKDLARVTVGQEVGIHSGHGRPVVSSRIGYLTPVLDPVSRTATARAVLDNPEGEWRPGMFVSAAVLDPIAVAIALPTSAVQTVESRPSVFVVGEEVEVRPVVLGRRGRTTVEILSGLAAGERVALTNTFLLKAELGKSEAEHHD